MTTEKKQEIINRLFAEQCSCIICNNHEIRLFHERGVKDIYRLLKEEPDFLNGSFIADKVIGKAAAALMILGGVKEVFAGVISRPALSLFQSHGIEPVLEPAGVRWRVVVKIWKLRKIVSQR